MSVISIRMDDTLKQQTEAVLGKLGLNMTTAVTIFAKAVVRENGIPFPLKAEPLGLASNYFIVEDCTFPPAEIEALGIDGENPPAVHD